MSTLPVIAAVDGSDDSLVALDWAFDAALLREAPLRVVHVQQYVAWVGAEILPAGHPDTEADPVIGAVRRYLAGRVERPVTEYLALAGAPGAALPEQGSNAQLLVLGSRGRGGFVGLLLGSSGMTAARDAECPVVVVPKPGRQVHGDMPIEPGPRVVVGLQVDSPDEATLSFAFAEAARRGARLQVVAAYAWPLHLWTATTAQAVPPFADQDAIEAETRTLAEGFLAPYRERHPEVRAEPHVAPGDAAGHLVAASKDATLVVVGRHRRRLLAPARMMGSVTQAVLLHAASPVAVVPPTPPEE
ncbi:universal stress protein [Streptomyces ferrugineus]|uniref:Universal stress protein n=1 Tax=Streptomyces ferrugineus TaxID=1413221 RepID=A0A7M2SCZ9_9ACTN|nr:universal stress protein [Streptomyces ferrugineus]QOV33655.1 universal stress protein [Streptomyces ferrugineus]